MENSNEFAMFGAGCFWGVEDAFRKLNGVVNVVVGYSGGSVDHPTYKMVCGGDTGHVEVVRIEYDPSRISYEELLKTFWENHDPTQVNRQGPDVGEQYKSVIFFHSPEQQEAAEKSRDKQGASGKYNGEIATLIDPASTFYPAEDYHQQYFAKQRGEVS